MIEQLAITTDRLTRHFKDVVAVDSLSIDVEPGEIIGVVGPDGAGKSTTLRMLASIMDPTSGTARVLGFDTVSESESIKSRIGYMAQQFNLYRDLTVWENLNFFADLHQVMGEERARQIDRLLGFSRLGPFRDRKAAHLSGGMQKKLALACALIHTPSILFLDEPTTGVDPISRRELWDILTELHLRKMTLVISTPYMDEAERCHRVVLLYRGSLIAFDPPEVIQNAVEGQLLVIVPSDLRRSRSLISELPGVLEVQVYGDQLRVFVRDSYETLSLIEVMLHSEGITLHSSHSARPRMEEAFIAEIRRKRKLANIELGEEE